MAIVSITEENMKAEIEESKLPVIIDVYASWCGPCQQMNPIFEELEKEMGNSYKFAKINVDDARGLSIKLGVTSVPTFVFMKNNEIKGKEVGYINKDAFKEKIKTLLG